MNQFPAVYVCVFGKPVMKILVSGFSLVFTVSAVLVAILAAILHYMENSTESVEYKG